jgi:hypothetical protein
MGVGIGAEMSIFIGWRDGEGGKALQCRWIAYLLAVGRMVAISLRATAAFDSELIATDTAQLQTADEPQSASE